MNWEAAGAVGEIVGAIAVFLSLAYLAIQIRAQSNESRAAAVHNIFEGFRDNIAAFADGEIAQIFVKANSDLSSLTEVERFRLVTSAQRVLRLWEEAFGMRKRGRLDNDIWNSMNRQYASIMGAPAIQYVWSIRKELYDDEFQAHVEQMNTVEYRL